MSVRHDSDKARMPSLPCTIYVIAFEWHKDPSCCVCTLILHTMLTSCHTKWSSISSKFQCCLWSLRGTVCNGETLRRDLNSMLVKKACWLSSSHTHTDGRCVKGISHTVIRGSPPGQQWEEMGLNETRKSGRRS